MSTPDGKWTVEVITTRGGQSYRVNNLHTITKATMNPPGQLVATIGEVRALLGDDFDRLVEQRAKRFDGGR